MGAEEEGGEGGEGVQVITEVTLNLWVLGFRVQPIRTKSKVYVGVETLFEALLYCGAHGFVTAI